MVQRSVLYRVELVRMTVLAVMPVNKCLQDNFLKSVYAKRLNPMMREIAIKIIVFYLFSLMLTKLPALSRRLAQGQIQLPAKLTATTSHFRVIYDFSLLLLHQCYRYHTEIRTDTKMNSAFSPRVCLVNYDH